jgi:hypothetical protein
MSPILVILILLLLFGGGGGYYAYGPTGGLCRWNNPNYPNCAAAHWATLINDHARLSSRGFNQGHFHIRGG